MQCGEIVVLFSLVFCLKSSLVPVKVSVLVIE